MPSSRTFRSFKLNSGVTRMRQSIGLKEASPWNRSKEIRMVWSTKACSPCPKKVELLGRAVLTLLGEGTRRPSKKVSEVAVTFRKTCWPSSSGQIGSSPLKRLRLKGSYQCGLVYWYSPFFGYRR